MEELLYHLDLTKGDHTSARHEGLPVFDQLRGSRAVGEKGIVPSAEFT